jgi:hypothetical protein
MMCCDDRRLGTFYIVHLLELYIDLHSHYVARDLSLKLLSSLGHVQKKMEYNIAAVYNIKRPTE